MLASTSVQRPSFSATVRSNAAASRVQARSRLVVRAASIAAEVSSHCTHCHKDRF